MDPLSEVLRAVRLTGGMFLNARFSAPWSVLTKIDAVDCRPFLTNPCQLIAYHFVIQGRLLCIVEDEPPVEVQAGEVVLLPRNDDHILASALGLSPIDARRLVRPLGRGVAEICHGGDGEITQLICGFLGSEEIHNPLLELLPRVLRLDVKEAASRAWIEATVRFAAQELASGKLSDSGVVSRLSEVLFVEAVRSYCAAQEEGGNGWMKGLADPQIGRALALIHREIGAPWSSQSLAREVAMSRSAFVERFTALVGVPPIRYLTTCRLHTAKLQLRETRKTVAQIANFVGYESEEAFSRAFKRQFGVAPARWRDANGGGQRESSPPA